MSTKAPLAILPVISLLLSACLWGVFWYPLRLLDGLGMAGLWSTLTIFGSALAVVMTVVLVRRTGIRSHPWLLLVLAVASGWCNVAFIQAVLEGNVVRITLLFFLSPLWTVLLGRLILGERLDGPAQITMLLAMTGAIIMLWDSDLGLPWPQDSADWLAISSGLGFALSNVMVRRLDEEDIWIKTVFAWVGVVILAAAWIVLSDSPWPQVSQNVVLMTVLFGGAAMTGMTLLVLYGLTHMPAHRAAVILLFELVAGALSAQLLTDEIVQPQEWSGGLMILTAAYFAARRHIRGEQPAVRA